MANNSLYDGILMPQGGIYEPGPPVMIPSAPAKQSAVVRALIASDPNGPGLSDPQSGMQGGWSQLQDFAESGSPSIPGPNGTTVAKDQTRLPGQVPAQFDPVEAYSGVPRNAGERAIEAFAPRSAAFSPWGPDWTSGINAVHVNGMASLLPVNNDIPLNLSSYPPAVVRGVQARNAAIQGSPVAQALVSANERPITYSAPVEAGHFAQGSPNQSFEKQNGMGSVTNSMASSSRWNTGY